LAREGLLKDKCGPRAKTFEHHSYKEIFLYNQQLPKQIEQRELFTFLSPQNRNRFFDGQFFLSLKQPAYP